MNLRLPELQKLDKKVQTIRVKGLKDRYNKVNEVLHYQGLPFVSKIIQTKLISQQYNNHLAVYFDVNKTRELIGWKYY